MASNEDTTENEDMEDDTNTDLLSTAYGGASGDPLGLNTASTPAAEPNLEPPAKVKKMAPIASTSEKTSGQEPNTQPDEEIDEILLQLPFREPDFYTVLLGRNPKEHFDNFRAVFQAALKSAQSESQPDIIASVEAINLIICDIGAQTTESNILDNTAKLRAAIETWRDQILESRTSHARERRHQDREAILRRLREKLVRLKVSDASIAQVRAENKVASVVLQREERSAIDRLSRMPPLRPELAMLQETILKSIEFGVTVNATLLPLLAREIPPQPDMRRVKKFPDMMHGVAGLLILKTRVFPAVSKRPHLDATLETQTRILVDASKYMTPLKMTAYYKAFKTAGDKNSTTLLFSYFALSLQHFIDVVDQGQLMTFVDSIYQMTQGFEYIFYYLHFGLSSQLGDHLDPFIMFIINSHISWFVSGIYTALANEYNKILPDSVLDARSVTETAYQQFADLVKIRQASLEDLFNNIFVQLKRFYKPCSTKASSTRVS